jgi:hypothetical protein
MALQGNGNETTTNGHNEGNMEGRKIRDGKADQDRERNRTFQRNIKKNKNLFDEVGKLYVEKNRML